MNRLEYKIKRREKVKKSVRKKISGTSERLRMSVFRSNHEIYVQLIDDDAGKTLISASSRDTDLKDTKGTKTERAKLVGETIAKKAKEAKIENVVFDRNGYLYHGRVKALAEAARENGLKF